MWGFHGEFGISKGKFRVSKGEFGVSKGKFGVSTNNLGFPIKNVGEFGVSNIFFWKFGVSIRKLGKFVVSKQISREN
jgi:hypothetical protein